MRASLIELSGIYALMLSPLNTAGTFVRDAAVKQMVLLT
ncbi:hypothetical protein GJV44_00898 [Candidatus Vallotia cooleyia]|nr:hypothetical protein GJV44_00898 [Candidatus Vallotia cooleyia]